MKTEYQPLVIQTLLWVRRCNLCTERDVQVRGQITQVDIRPVMCDPITSPVALNTSRMFVIVMINEVDETCQVQLEAKMFGSGVVSIGCVWYVCQATCAEESFRINQFSVISPTAHKSKVCLEGA